MTDDQADGYHTDVLASARVRAGADGRWVLIAMHAPQCPACARLNTTWRDETVRSWISARAVLVILSTLEANNVATALHVVHTPTVLAERDGIERDRVATYLGPMDLLAWLQGLENGKTYAQQMQALIDDMEHDVDGRLRYANALLRARRFDEAATEYRWVWEHIDHPNKGLAVARLRTLATETRVLLTACPALRQRIGKIRNQLAEAATASSALSTGMFGHAKWIVINEILGDSARTLEWFDTVKLNPDYAEVLRELPMLEAILVRAPERRADIGRLIKDPLGILNDILAEHGGKPRQQLRRAVFLYDCLLAAGRFEDARQVEWTVAMRDQTPMIQIFEQMRLKRRVDKL